MVESPRNAVGSPLVVPHLAAVAAASIRQFSTYVTAPDVYTMAEIDGFKPYMNELRNCLVEIARDPSPETGRVFLLAASRARLYGIEVFLLAASRARSHGIENFQDDHGFLTTSYDAMEAVAELTGLNIADENRARSQPNLVEEYEVSGPRMR